VSHAGGDDTPETTDDQSLRLFTAIEIPEEHKNQIRQLTSHIQKGLDFGGAHPAWVPAENLHITLAFLGSQPAERVPEVQQAMMESAADIEPFKLSIGNLELFPTPKQPKVISIAVRGNTSAVEHIYEKLSTALSRRGFKLDERAFRPHLTLARIKSFRGLAAVRSVLSSHNSFTTGQFEINSIVLYRSILKRPAPEYQILERTPLATSSR
jgi:RNA 2',3'-cyclic 3'-phosphodiesterase